MADLHETTAEIEFFWDPMCPWAWITSRWVVEVASQQPLHVTWSPISLFFLNEGHYDRYPEGYSAVHHVGLELLRVAMAAGEAHGEGVVGALYTDYGRQLHLGDRKEVAKRGGPSIAAESLATLGLPAALVDAAADEAFDAGIRASTDLALERAGKDLGTPILTLGPPDGPSFFGPVVSRVPRGPEAVELWDAVWRLARFPGFAELKRSLRERPQTRS